MTWDLLFYGPLSWVGPIITPVLIALAMMVALPASLSMFHSLFYHEVDTKYWLRLSKNPKFVFLMLVTI
jgi:hypothetical protein